MSTRDSAAAAPKHDEAASGDQPELEAPERPSAPEEEAPASEPQPDEQAAKALPAAERARFLDRFWSAVLATYATADPRSLGAFRIALGTLLFVDVARRIPDLSAHYSNAGWLSNHFALFRPMSSHQFSVYLAFGTPVEVKVAIALHLLVNLLLLVGFKTRIMHVLAAVLITSLNSRNILLENGGWVVLNILTVWTLFLPLGRRYSIDSLIRSWRARREGTASALNDRETLAPDKSPVVTLAVTALILQWAVIYYFNVVHKGGPPWRDGTAVYYFFQQDRMVTDLGAWIRGITPLWAIKGLTWSTLAIEGAIVALLIAPVRSGKLRMVAFALCVTLHLSIDLVVQLGPFSWAMIIMFVALVPGWIWDRLEQRRLNKRPRRLVVFDPKSGVSLTICRFIKRMDAVGLVEFVPIGEDAALPAGLKKKTVRRSLVVLDEARTTCWTGADAIARLADALPIPARVFALPGIRSLIARRIERVLAKRHANAALWGVDDLPGSDRVAAEPSEARQFVRAARNWVAQLAVLALMIALGSQVLIENRAVPEWLKPKQRPEWMTSVVIYPRLFQGWSMFAPSPPGEDGRLVVEGRTADGRRLDPLTGTLPIYEVQPKEGFRMNQIWGDFHRRIGEPRFSAYLGGVRDMLLGYHEITGRPEDKLVAFDLWYVTEIIPPPGAPRPPPTRRKLISQGSVTYPPGLQMPPEYPPATGASPQAPLTRPDSRAPFSPRPPAQPFPRVQPVQPAQPSQPAQPAH